MEALRSNQMVTIRSVSDDHRWPEFTDAAERFGINSTLSLPLSGADVAIGALNVYSRQPHAFNYQDKEYGAGLATQAAVLLIADARLAEAREVNNTLKQALGSRVIIEHAIGILIATTGHSPQEASRLLRRASERQQTTQEQIAIQLVERAQTRPTTSLEATKHRAVMSTLLDAEPGSSSTIFAASGELDVATGPLLGSCLQRLIGMGNIQIVVDLSDVTFMDSSGLAALLGAFKVAVNAGGSLSVRSPQDQVRRVFELTRMDTVIAIIN